MASPIMIALCFATIIIDRGNCVHPDELNLIFFGVHTAAELGGLSNQNRVTAITNKLCPLGEVQNLEKHVESLVIKLPFKLIQHLIQYKLPRPFAPTVKVKGTTVLEEPRLETKVQYFQLLSAVEADSIEEANTAGIECLRTQNGEFVMEYFPDEKMDKISALVFNTVELPDHKGTYVSLIHAELTGEGQDESEDFWIE